MTDGEAGKGEAGGGGNFEEAQRTVVAFLASAEAHSGETPEHITTHLSHIFMAGDRVLKLKRALRWAMVDYSTLARREALCREEVAINSRFAPELYRAVRTVVRKTDGRLALGEETGSAGGCDGGPVDYVVEMRRFPAEHQLDEMVEAGTLTPALADAAADAIAALHRSAPVVRTPANRRTVTALAEQLARDTRAALQSPALREATEAWKSAIEVRIDEVGRHLDARGRHGFVRRCHGDLHLSNICLWNGRPTPFDAIEFAPEMATIDVLHDLAFVLVDLEHRGRGDLANRLLSRYLEETRDYAGLRVLAVFKSLRAMVRALVGVAKGRDPAPHIAAARALAAPRPGARLLAIGGLSGTGKTTIARALAPAIDAVVIRSDTVRKRLHGTADTAPLPPSAYTDAARAAVYRRMNRDAAAALRADAAVILDATFLDRAARDAAARLADEHGVPFTGVWLEAALSTRLARVEGRSGDASDADAAVVRRQDRDAGAPLSWHTVDASGEAAATVRAIESLLAAHIVSG